MPKLKDHPLAKLFPLMEKAELAELASDIKEHGQRAPITLLDGKILDGRNRHRACLIAGIEPKTRDFKDNGDPVAFVLSVNLRRRHLSASQRALVAAKLANLGEGHPKRTASKEAVTPVSQSQAADLLNVSRSSVQRATTVLLQPKLADSVEAGKITVRQAATKIEEKKHAGDVLRDDTGYAIPENVRPLWARKQEATDLCKVVSKARSAVRDLQAKDDPLYVEVNVNAALSHLNNAYSELKQSIPHAVCPYCNGQAKNECTFCKGRGLVSQFRLGMAPVELIEVRKKSCVTK